MHVVPAIAKESSGPTYSVTRLCDALIGQGNEVTLAALDWGRPSSPPAYLMQFPIGFGPRRLGRSPALKRWLSANVATGSVDILHTHGMWQMNSIYPAWVSRGSAVKLVASPRGAFSEWAMDYGSRAKRVFWPMLQRPALRRADCFHATSDAEYEDIRRLGFRQPVAVIPNGIDVPADAGGGPASSRRTLLFLGRIHPAKGLDLLLRSWAQLQESFPDWDLLIVGGDTGYDSNSSYLSALRETAADLGLTRLRFAGELRGAGKWAAYQQAALFVLPTRSENFAIAVAEALAAGLPAVVTRGAPWRGLVERKAGWWVDISVEALVMALREAMLLEPRALAAMGQRGREWMRRDFAWDDIGRRMADTYRWLVGDLGQRPDWIRTN